MPCESTAYHQRTGPCPSEGRRRLGAQFDNASVARIPSRIARDMYSSLGKAWNRALRSSWSYATDQGGNTNERRE